MSLKTFAWVSVLSALWFATEAQAQLKPPEIKESAVLEIDPATRQGTVSVTLEIAPAWHVYPINQAEGGLPTRIRLKQEDPQLRITGPFVATIPPGMIPDKAKGRVPAHEGRATWTAPVQATADADLQKLAIELIVEGSVCRDGQCKPLRFPVVALQAGQSLEMVQLTSDRAAPEQPSAPKQTPGAAVSSEFGGPALRLPGTFVAWRGFIDHQTVRPGDQVTLTLEGVPDDGWVFFNEADADLGVNDASAVFQLIDTAGLSPGRLTRSKDFQREVIADRSQNVLSGPVRWTVPLQVPKELEPGRYTVRGQLVFRSAAVHLVTSRWALEVTGTLTVGESVSDSPTGLSFFQSTGTTALAADATDPNDLSGSSLGIVLLLALAAGLILNIMPCVLPVIGLKIMAFAGQGGQNHRRVFTLNLVFALGMMSVFMLLAALAAMPQLAAVTDEPWSWGNFFKNVNFVIVMIAIIFVFGLSFFGVWEIPIPGFVGSGGASKVAEREGYIGAFAKGVLSTILATPCSGPLLIPVVTWATSQPPALTFMVFGAIGLGMASPYLLIGMMPQLVRLLPRPGPWMVTFKQLMGFLMMGTVVFLLASVPEHLKLPVLSLLVALGLACWIVGRGSLADSLATKARRWIASAVIAGAGIAVAFTVFQPRNPLDWQPFSHARLTDAIANGQTVFVDFTADWCATCKVNEAVALNRHRTKQFFTDHSIVALKADMTSEAIEASELLASLGNASLGIPYYAIFVPGDPHPTHFGGIYLTSSMVIDRIEQARAEAEQTVTAARTLEPPTPSGNQVSRAGLPQ